MTLDDCRRFYAEEIRVCSGVTSSPLLDAFARVPRETFLGPGPWKIAAADLALGGTRYIETQDADPRHLYHNVPIALDVTRDLNNGQPGTLARWIDMLDLKPGDRVFHLGCGVGYFTAIMAEMVGPKGEILASEIDETLAARARQNLSSYPNITVHSGDGATLDPGPCDAVLINAGITHPHNAWLACLREGGRLVFPLTVPMAATLGKGVMVRIRRESGGFAARVLTFVAIYSCASMRDPKLEPVIGKGLSSMALLKMKSLRLDAHTPGETCVLHTDALCFSSAPLSGS